MYRQKTISVYFPCRNEAAHLDTIIKTVPSFVDETIIVSNRSTDNTMEVARSLGVRALEDNRTKGNIGYGFAHMTGLQAATGDIIATADADGTYPVTDLAKIIDFLIDNDLDFVSCSRYPVQEGTSISTLLKF
jgi:glycosyltransferase involved in cell wall biosynthesis